MTPENQKTKKINCSKFLKYLIYIVLAICFINLLKTLDLESLVLAFREFKLPTIFLLIVLQIITELMLVMQWQGVGNLVGEKFAIFELVNIQATGTLLEAITPGVKIGGEFTRVYLFKKRLALSTGKAINIVLLQKFLSVISIMLLVIIALPFISLGTYDKYKGNLLLVSGIIILLLLIFFLLSDFLNQKILEMPANKKKYLEKIRLWFLDFTKDLAAIKSKGWALIPQFAFALIIWLMYPLKLYLLLSSITANISYFSLLGITLFSYMLAMLPIVPGGLLIFEITMGSLLAVHGLSAELSLSAAIIFRFISFWFVTGLSGIYVFIIRHISKILIRERGRQN